MEKNFLLTIEADPSFVDHWAEEYTPSLTVPYGESGFAIALARPPAHTYGPRGWRLGLKLACPDPELDQFDEPDRGPDVEYVNDLLRIECRPLAANRAYIRIEYTWVRQEFYPWLRAFMKAMVRCWPEVQGQLPADLSEPVAKTLRPEPSPPVSTLPIGDQPTAGPPDSARAHPPGGRPPDPDYDWAFGEITRGRKQKDVFKEWCLLPSVEARESTDLEDMFDKAIRSRRRKAAKQKAAGRKPD